MSPGPLQRLKSYFKPRPRAGKPQPAQPAPPAGAPPAAAQPVAPADASALKQRRAQLADRFGELQSDLGGLAYEMAIRDYFRLDVLVRRAAELQAVDSELRLVEQRLGMATAAPATTSCPSCGSVVQLGAQYCGRCGSGLAQSASGTRAQPPASSPSAPASPEPTSAASQPTAESAPANARPATNSQLAPTPAAGQTGSRTGGSR